MSRLITTEEFISKSIARFGSKFAYPNTIYMGRQQKVKVCCAVHGEVSIRPFVHLRGEGCPHCAILKQGQNRTGTLESFVQRANEIHQNLYDYSKTVFVKMKSSVIVTCKQHGDFSVSAFGHIHNKIGCQQCSINNRGIHVRQTIDDFFKELRQKPNFEQYDFSGITEFKNLHEKKTVRCKSHGIYQTKLKYIKQGVFFGCKQCKIEKHLRFTTEQFVERSKEVHKERLDYGKVDYLNAHTDVILTCKTHGDFACKPYVHLAGGGFCQSCFSRVSSAETEIKDFLQEHGIVVKATERKIEGVSEVDLVSHEHKIAIEFNGLYWHSSARKPRDFHLKKTQACAAQGYRLIHIFEDEWLDKKEICKSMLLNAFKKTPVKVFARKCKIQLVSDKDAKTFLSENHLQGACLSKVRLGLFDKNQLVSLMTFGANRKCLGNAAAPNEFELLRFCNKINHNVVGGASKLLQYFIANHSPQKITSYCNRNYGTGKLYETLGFVFLHNTSPNYFYVKGTKKFSRFRFRKDVLVRKGYEPTKTEKEIMNELGFLRIYDCGSMKFELRPFTKNELL